MISDSPSRPVSRGGWWTGTILTALAVLFLAMNVAMKFARPEPVVKAFNELGWSPDKAPALGIIQLICLVLYLIPRTAVLGAVLWTGYLGGAIATHVRVGNPLLSHTLFPIYIAAFLWAGLVLRRPSILAAMFPRN